MATMPTSFQILALLSLGSTVRASPLDIRQQSVWNPYSPCATCFRSTWTQGPECTTNTILQSTISRILNPPASETATYTPSKWCTDWLRETEWSYATTTISAKSTYTDQDVTHLFVTVTDYDHPTETVFCPSPSPNMECGWDSNTVAPIDQGRDEWMEHFYTPEKCQQQCLQRPDCKAYRVQEMEGHVWYCEVFYVGLGRNATNVRNPTPSGTQWWDRNCQAHIPTPCHAGGSRTPPPVITTAPPPTTADLTTSSMTPTPTLSQSHSTTDGKVQPTNASHLAKRNAPFPPYMKDLQYVWSSLYITPACSCIITSALPPIASTSTRTETSWTETTTFTSVFEDWFTVTVTPRKTTTYNSIN